MLRTFFILHDVLFCPFLHLFIIGRINYLLLWNIDTTSTYNFTIVYDNLILRKKYNNTTARLSIQLGISFVIFLIGFIIFHNLYQ
ncbi:hypothetical protein J2T26_003025 [Citrobacter farmeri]|nr:hypothetical protein [Citrobacter farmeri]MCW2423555.1 hypothetical protein [Citrobacter farmeri]